MVIATRNSFFACAYGPHIFVSNGKASVQVSASAQVIALAFNADASILLAASQDKQLASYKVETSPSFQITLVESREVPRNATSMVTTRYTNEGQSLEAVLIAVNAGEVMAYPVPHVKSHQGKSLLAHTTSIVTDVAINSEESLLLTADRDEKIRVTNFPATTLVQSYCLGHRQCVRKLAVSVKTPTQFVSVGLDDTLKLWNISTGELLDSVDLASSGEAETKHCGVTVCPSTDHVAVVRNSTKQVELFQIENNKLTQLREELTSGDAQPVDVQFVADGHLVVAYNQAPFLQLFAVNDTALQSVGIPELEGFIKLSENTVLAKESNDDNDGDSEDGELRKKKLKPSHWKAKLPSGQKATRSGE
ncbi:unnamed protein product [Aphanomyces euteiches]